MNWLQVRQETANFVIIICLRASIAMIGHCVHGSL